MGYILQEEIAKAPLPTLEHMLGKGSMMPFNGSNSGGRKLMFGVNLEQRLPLMNPDVPYIGTGFEYQFGIYSSSYVTSDADYRVAAVIPKFASKPNYHNFYLMVGKTNGMIKVVEAAPYKHLTEDYGYLVNLSHMDAFGVGDDVKKGECLMKSKAFDMYDNRMDGRNLLTLFTSCEKTMEDSIKISESCAKKLASPLIHKIKIVLNDNDIPLNIYGDRQDKYKICPDIGEQISNSIVMAYRREKKEEALFNQSFDRLCSITLSDEKIRCSGKVIDIDVYANNPQKLDGMYFEQIKFYYDQQLIFARSLVDAVNVYLTGNYKMDYDLQKLYHHCVGILNGKQYFNERAFSGINLEITVLEEIPAGPGDKLTNRYGGKGVISEVVPDDEMPRTYAGEIFDAEVNICGVYGRENGGQLFELTCTSVSRALVMRWADENLNTGTCYNEYLTYLRIVAPSQAAETERIFSGMSDDVISELIGSMVVEGAMNVEINPMSENMSIFKVIQLYQAFPWIEQEYLMVPLEDSNGRIQYIMSRRPVVPGYIYYYRLKQHAKEKFSVTSMSATNIRNENSRNKASKVYKALFPRTPIRFGDMEIGDLSHLGADIIVQILMLYASSPLARQLYESLMTGDPFNVDIHLDDTSSNRNAEIVETYLKTIGKRLIFRKIAKKKEVPIEWHPISFLMRENPIWEPIIWHPEIPGSTMYPSVQEARKNPHWTPLAWHPITYITDPELIDERLKEDAEKRRLKLIEAGVIDENGNELEGS